MAKLILSMDGLVLKEIPLNKERLNIGRKPNNDVQIDNMAISGEHARIVTILNDSFLEDMNSTNGTLVNGHPIKKHVLRNNDVIELGKYKLKYISSDAQLSDFTNSIPIPVESIPIETQQDLLSTQAQTDIAQTVVISDLPPAAVQLLNGPNSGKELELTKTLTTLGKPGQQVAVIAKRSQGYFITHVEGQLPTLLNNEPFGPQAKQLSDHDVIDIAGIKMEFFLKT